MRISVLVLLFISLKASAWQSAEAFLPAKTTGKLPMLAYGLGEDRLGGAKAGYIDTNVLLRVIDSTKEMYLVRLSKAHTAYISKDNMMPDNPTRTKPFYLTNSWSVKGDKAYDFVTISMDERLPYKSWMEVNPSKIIVDLYGVQSNTNWITQLQSAQEIKEVYSTQLEDDVVRVTIELKHRQQWGYSINYDGYNLVVRVRRQPTDLRIKKLKIAIDAGHGGTNTGVTGLLSKTFEKDYTLRFAEELQKHLEQKGVAVIMTRTSDTNILSNDRVLFLQQEMPVLLISLHLNSSTNANVKGVSTYYKHIGFKPLTTAILNRLLELNLNEFGNVGNFNFTLNAPTDFLNSLVEIAFLSNAEDEKRILDPRFQKATAKKIYRGIKDWLNAIED
jgi:N-acetylmuramoyl-L-alanine amidase